MGKETAKKMFEWYADVGLSKLKEIKKDENFSFKDCKTRKEFSDYMLRVFIAYHGLRCTCDDCMDWDFSNAGGHYHHCDLYKFSYIVNRCLDWAEHHNKIENKPCEVSGNSSQS